MSRGALYALGSYILWGLLPLYWKELSALPGLETTSHRVIWCALFAAIVLTWRRNWSWLGNVLQKPRVLITYLATAALILVNWLIYIYAVNNNHVVEASLGYFMNPLVNVLLGIIFLSERPRLWQWIAISIATLGVAYLTYDFGTLPWVALGLAVSFGLYGLLKKTAALPAMEGLFLEMSFLVIPLAIYLVFLDQRGVGAFGHSGWQTTILLIVAGIVTALPLLLFSAGARLISLTMLGILQYVAPTIQFIIGILVFHEPFSQGQLIGFSFIWLALILFTLESTAEHRRLQFALRVR